jgi:mannitol/fructose-specific phosphotransferase system IIA component (Ntr-type)
MALLTSLVSGPAMKWLLRGVDEEMLTALLARGAWVHRLKATTPAAAIEELAGALARPLAGLETRAVRAVLDREAVAPTGLGDEVAIPHATVPGLQHPVLALGASSAGIDFNAPDGRPAKLVFLLFMPPRAHDQEVRILAQIAQVAIEPAGRTKLVEAKSLNDVLACIAEHRPHGGLPAGSRASLADI